MNDFDSKQAKECFLRIRSSFTRNKDEGIFGICGWGKEILDLLQEANELTRRNSLTQGDYLYLRQALADYLDLIFNFYGRSFNFRVFIFEFQKILFTLLRENGGLLEDPGVVLQGKRIPGLAECCRATLIRLEALQDLSDQLGNIEGMIVGGSVSYGRFYNIRDSQEDSSDIDVILVANNEREIEPLVRASFLDAENRKLFRKRLKELRSPDSEEPSQVLSQRFYYKDRGFTISFHCFEWGCLKRVIDNLCLDLSRQEDASFLIEDCRSDAFKEGFFTHYNFNGQGTVSAFENRKERNSYRAHIPIYMIRNGEFYSSMYFNVILPERWVLLDRRGKVSDLLESFRASLVQRLNWEREQDPQKMIIKSHIRYPLFRNSISV